MTLAAKIFFTGVAIIFCITLTLRAEFNINTGGHILCFHDANPGMSTLWRRNNILHKFESNFSLLQYLDSWKGAIRLGVLLNQAEPCHIYYNDLTKYIKSMDFTLT